MSKYICKLKDEGKAPSITWNILSTLNCRSTKGVCRLYVTENLWLLKHFNDVNLLNKKSESIKFITKFVCVVNYLFYIYIYIYIYIYHIYIIYLYIDIYRYICIYILGKNNLNLQIYNRKNKKKLLN